MYINILNFDNSGYAFLISLLAGLSTGIGAILALFIKKSNTKFLAFSLVFSAGVMIYVSFVEIYAESDRILVNSLGNKGPYVSMLAFFAGAILMALIDLLIPEDKYGPVSFDTKNLNTKHNLELNKAKLYRTGVLTAVVIAIHNFPEGVVTFFTLLSDSTLAITIAIAIALHNIPEGISIYVPIYYATGNKKKAFGYSLFSGLVEPLGAIIGFLVLREYLNDIIFEIIFGIVVGIMVYISLDELLPSARKYGEAYLTIIGLFAGMFIMAFSLILL